MGQIRKVYQIGREQQYKFINLCTLLTYLLSKAYRQVHPPSNFIIEIFIVFYLTGKIIMGTNVKCKLITYSFLLFVFIVFFKHCGKVDFIVLANKFLSFSVKSSKSIIVACFTNTSGSSEQATTALISSPNFICLSVHCLLLGLA